MRWIRKGHEPACLAAHRVKADASYANLPTDCRQEVREALVREQGGLCAFCMRRIRATEQDMKIAHRYPQRSGDDTGAARSLDWSNMLGACKGGEGSPRKHQTCDTRQGNDVIEVDPTQQTHMRAVQYASGSRVSSAFPRHAEDFDVRLNLNHARLTDGRKEALNGLLDAFGRTSAGTWKGDRIRRQLETLRTGPELVEYVGVLEHYLEKRLARL